MTHANENIEALIIRSVHGELDDEESLSLNRELLRRPELRDLKSEYEALDRATTAALAAWWSRPVNRDDATEMLSGPRRSRRTWLTVERWFIPSAVAAMILIAVFLPGQRDASRNSSPVPNPAPTVATRGPWEQPPAVRVGTTPTSVRRNTSRDVVGVIGKDGRFYILEMDRTRTLRTPGRPTSTTARTDGL